MPNASSPTPGNATTPVWQLNDELPVYDDPVPDDLVTEVCVVGRGLEPPRTLVWISADRATLLRRARPIELRLDAGLLGARCLALATGTPSSARRDQHGRTGARTVLG